MTRRSLCDRVTASDGDLSELLDKWYPASVFPKDDRIVLILRVSPLSRTLLRDMGYYDGEWKSSHGDPLHPVVFWKPYPKLPDWRG